MKKKILLLSALILSACTVNTVSSGDDSDFEDSSDEDASALSSGTSEAQEDELISLYNDSSHLYAVSDVEESSPFLKTYRHREHDDVPYVDLDEFQHVRRYIDAALKYHNLVKMEDGRYDLSSSFDGH